MASSYANPPGGHTSRLIELPGSEEISISDGEPSQQEIINRQLTQALNYLQEEGGHDSPATFIDRVNRIDRALLYQLPQQGYAFDRNLYRRVCVLVHDALHDFEEAAKSEPLQLEADENMARYYDPYIDEEALYRASDSSPSPTPRAAAASHSEILAPRHHGSGDNVQRQREFMYGGPNNEVENWLKDYPNSLPFPETFLMAHWESLKIDYDLSRPISDTVMETNVPFTHEQLQPYFHLDQYESGSQFKLPQVSKKDQEAISRYGTGIQIKNVLDNFYRLETTEGGVQGYAPPVFLEKFEVGNQIAPSVHIVSPNQIRRSLNASPSPKTSTNAFKRSSPPLMEDCSYDTNNTPVARPNIELAVSTPHPRNNSASKPPQEGPSAAFRRISKEVRRSSVSSTTESAISTPKPASIPKSIPTSIPTKVATHVVIPKRGRGRPRKSPLPSKASPVSEIPVQSLLGKRKHSVGSQPYTPPKSSIKNALRDAKRLKVTTQKTVGFVDVLEEDSEDPNYPASPANRPTRTVANAKKPAIKGSKAAAAGKQVRKGKDKIDNVRRGTTRSGTMYLK